METKELIAVDVFCNVCKIEVTLIEELSNFGLIEIIHNDGLTYLNTDHLAHLERIIRFHNDLKINKEGIEVILSLLQRLEKKNTELKFLQEMLKLHQ